MLTQPDLAKIDRLTEEINAQKVSIQEACLRLGQAFYEAHKDDPEDSMSPDVKLVKDANAAIEDMTAEIRDCKGLTLCPVCGKEIPKEDIFCSFCGNRVREPEPEPEPEPEVKPQANCVNCGKPLLPGQKFCTYCGTRVAENKPEPRVCKVCGTELTEGARFCFECGTPVT